MPRLDVTIKTRDGICPASLFTPGAGSGPWPGIIFFMDALAIRPVLQEMAQQLADGGFAVLLPDMYYRSGPVAPMDPAAVFADPEKRAELMALVKSLDRDRKVSDTEAFLAFLASRPEVTGKRYGATGYCMGGNAALTAGGAFPDRFAAVASFHGGQLASADPDSPHRFIGAMSGRVYVAGAIEDASFPPEQQALLAETLTAAGVDHSIEIYAGAHHGFAVPDIPVYDPAAAKRHWDASYKLFDETLGPAHAQSPGS